MGDGLNIDEIDERFFVHGRMEIHDLLNELIYRCEPVTVAFGEERFSTYLLEVRDQAVIFDASSDPALNLRLLSCKSCSLTAFPDGIRVQFSGSGVQQIVWGEKEIFQAPLPDRVARLQRQETFRAVMPPDRQIPVRLFSGEGTELGEWPLRDLSTGGLGIAMETETELAAGRNVARIRLSLPGHREIDCKVELRHLTDLASRESSSPYRLGMSFLELATADRAAIQRYVIDVEHERRNAFTEHEENESRRD